MGAVQWRLRALKRSLARGTIEPLLLPQNQTSNRLNDHPHETVLTGDLMS
jgi:hypothetical protein